MKKTVKISVCLIILVTILMMSSQCFAAWWGTPGYEWALSKNLTSMKTQAQLNREVTLSDYYSIILNYLRMKNVEPSGRVVQNLYVEGIYNGAINGLVEDINSRIGTSVTSITPQQYRVIEDLTQHGKKQIVEYAEYLYRDDLKNLNLYFDLARYRAATLLTEDTKIEREYKSRILYSLRNTKYVDSITYGIMPMCGSDITRQSFLVLMYNLLSDTTSTADSILRSFHESAVLIGYSDSVYTPGLRNNLTYAEMFAFLYRFETYDFNTTDSQQ